MKFEIHWEKEHSQKLYFVSRKSSRNKFANEFRIKFKYSKIKNLFVYDGGGAASTETEQSLVFETLKHSKKH
jgi:hypothetical protein